MSNFVSILIPCYNAERWISAAIESALAQTYAPIEVLVVDDGSTDGSLEIIKRFGDRIHWETGANHGGNVVRNGLLNLARGEWVQYLDADDYLLPDKLQQQMKYLQADPATDVLYGQVTKEDWTKDGVSLDLQVVPEPHDPWILLARWYLPQTGGPIWRKAALQSIGGWKPDQPCCQEHELYLRLLMSGKRFTYCPHNGAIYRTWSEGTVSHRNKAQTRRERLKILERAETFLRDTHQLSAPRQNAISLARFEMARLAWPEDPGDAKQFVDALLRSDPGFRPRGNQPGGHHPPAFYRLLWRLLGFRVAENAASGVRFFRRRFGAG
jgi:glycosyltransferase involved in cell wall biosynthesis